MRTMVLATRLLVVVSLLTVAWPARAAPPLIVFAASLYPPAVVFQDGLDSNVALDPSLTQADRFDVGRAVRLGISAVTGFIRTTSDLTIAEMEGELLARENHADSYWIYNITPDESFVDVADSYAVALARSNGTRAALESPLVRTRFADRGLYLAMRAISPTRIHMAQRYAPSGDFEGPLVTNPSWNRSLEAATHRSGYPLGSFRGDYARDIPVSVVNATAEACSAPDCVLPPVAPRPAIPPALVYRASPRPPEVVFREGFVRTQADFEPMDATQGADAYDLGRYLRLAGNPSAVSESHLIATIADATAVRENATPAHPTTTGRYWVYGIVPDSSFVDVRWNYRMALFHAAGNERLLRTLRSMDVERLFTGGQPLYVSTDDIAPQRISYAQEYDARGLAVGAETNNVGFVIPSIPTVRRTSYPVGTISGVCFLGLAPRRQARSLGGSVIIRDHGVCPPAERAFSEEAPIDFVTSQEITTSMDWGDRREWIDADGDGQKDLCVMYERSSTIKCYKNGNGATEDWKVLFSKRVDDLGWSDARWFVDVLGNGIPAYCRLVYRWTQMRCDTFVRAYDGTILPSVVLESKYLDGGWAGKRWWVDVNGDGKSDYCRSVGWERMACSLAKGNDGIDVDDTIESENIDFGWPDSRGWADVFGDGHPAYCRVAGGSTYIRCLRMSRPGGGNPADVWTDYLDGGYWGTRRWVDVDHDGKTDFCREIGIDGARRISCVFATAQPWALFDLTEHYSVAVDAGWRDSISFVDLGGGKPAYCRLIGGWTKLACLPNVTTTDRQTVFGADVVSDYVDGGWPSIDDGRRAWLAGGGPFYAQYCRSVDHDRMRCTLLL